MPAFTIGQGARRPILTATLLEDGAAIDLTSASGVTFYALQSDGTTKITGACSVTSASDGEISYTWAANDTDNPGVYRMVFRIDWGSSVYQDVPTASTATLEVTPSPIADT